VSCLSRIMCVDAHALGFLPSLLLPACLPACQAIMESGLTFIDTAEVYGFGYSESFLGEFMRETGTRGTVQVGGANEPSRFTWQARRHALLCSLRAVLVVSASVQLQTCGCGRGENTEHCMRLARNTAP
jgi:diketogulonate reductase-like aldo/keto reductase